MGALRMLLRRWRADRGLLALLVVVVAAASGLVGAVPRLLDQLARASLDEELATTTADRKGMAADRIQLLDLREPDADWAELEAAGAELQRSLTPALDRVLRDPTPVVDTFRYAVFEAPGGEWDTINRRLTVRSQLDLPELDVVEGRLPDGEIGIASWPSGELDDGGEPVMDSAPLHEVAMTAESAQAMRMEVGDQRIATVDREGPMARRLRLAPEGTVVFELAAIVELAPMDDPVWFGDPVLHRSSQYDTSSNTTVFAHAIVPPSAAAELPKMEELVAGTVTWRWRLDEQALIGADPTAVADGARALRTSLALDPTEPSWSTGLDQLIDRERDRRATAVEVLGLAVVAVVGVAVALLGAIGVVLATRRRDATALMRGRGTSAAQAVGAAAVEAVVVAAAGAGLALTTLAALLPGSGGEWLVVGVAVLASIVLVATAWPDVTRPLGALLAERRRGEIRSRRRLGRPVLEGLVVLVAVVATVATRQRGVGVDGEIDPLVVAAPAAVALAVAVLAARLVPVLLGLVGPLAVRRRRGLAAPLGVARATRQGRGGPVVLLVTLGVGISATALAVHTSIVVGQAAAASERVGADVRIVADALATLDAGWASPDPDALVVDAAVVDGAISGETGGGAIDVVLLDAEAVAALADASSLPSLVWDGVAPAPVITSSNSQALGSPEVGAGLTLTIERRGVAVTLADVDPQLLGFDDEDGRFAVIDEAAVTSVTGSTPEPTVRLVDTDEPSAVAFSAQEADPTATVTTREEVRASLAESPLALGVRVGFLVAAGAVGIATLLAVVLALAAAAPVRRREAAVLAAVGTTGRRIAAVAVAEVVPTVLLACAVGLGLAVAVATVVGARLDLASFTGTVGATTVGGPPLLATVALVVTVVAISAAAAVLTIGRVDTAALLREGE